MKKRIRQILFLAIVGMLFLPAIQFATGFFEVSELSGAYKKTNAEFQKPKIYSLRSGEFQTQFEEYWRNKVGLKNWLIRINNQINYKLFNQTEAVGVIIGKDKIVHQLPYIKTYFGVDNVGRDSIVYFLEGAKRLQDSLDKRGKFLGILLAPSKTSIYPESIPDRYLDAFEKKPTNYDLLIEEAQKRGVRLLDIRAYILRDKEKFKHPIFPKNGIHWSGNTVAMVADTLFQYINSNSNFQLPELELSKGEITVDNYRFTDYDIGEAMNLMWNVSSDELHYPEIKYKRTNQERPTFLGVGDSFIQSLYGFYPILDSSFSDNSKIWYYNKKLDWPMRFKGKSIVTQWLSKEIEIDRSDIIIMEMSEENIRQTSFGFVDDLLYVIDGKQEINEELRPLYNSLMNDPKLKEKADKIYAEVGYTKEQMIDALVKNKLKNKWLINFDYNAELEKVILSIKADEKWLNAVKEKAIQKNISLEESMKRDAVWVVNDKLGLN